MIIITGTANAGNLREHISNNTHKTDKKSKTHFCLANSTSSSSVTFPPDNLVVSTTTTAATSSPSRSSGIPTAATSCRRASLKRAFSTVTESMFSPPLIITYSTYVQNESALNTRLERVLLSLTVAQLNDWDRKYEIDIGRKSTGRTSIENIQVPIFVDPAYITTS